jgi:hypothetical protein
MSLRITFIGSTNFLCFLAATGRRLQPPSFSSYNLKEAPTPQFYGYNQKFLRLQHEGTPIPQFSGYNQKETTTPFAQPNYNHLSFPCPTTLMYK